VESSPFMKYNIAYKPDPADIIAHAVAQSAVNILHEVDAKCVVVFSQSGSTAKQVSKQRTSRPVYAFTSSKDTYHRLSLLWGVSSMYIPHIEDANRLIKASENLLIDKHAFEKGDLIVLVIGTGLKQGSTNMIKIHRVGHQEDL
jgi:pyruvate kinase